MSDVVTVAVITFKDTNGNEWIAGASITRLRPKGAPLDSEMETIQLTEANTKDWKLKEFRVVEPS